MENWLPNFALSGFPSATAEEEAEVE